jgi:hypothetical protein
LRSLRSLFEPFTHLPETGKGLVEIALFVMAAAGGPIATYAAAFSDEFKASDWGIGRVLTAASISLFVMAFLAIYRLQRFVEQYEEKTPTLAFGEAVEYHAEIIDSTPGKLWRVPITNVQRNSVARSAQVRLTRSNPSLPLLPVTLHQMHDNIAPFKENRDLRFSEPVVMDIVGQNLANPRIFYVFRADLGDHSDQVGLDFTLNDEGRIWPAVHNDGWRLRLEAHADPPAAPIEQEYVIRADMNSSPIPSHHLMMS